MARIPYPTKIKILNGEKNKNRINLNEPQPRNGKPSRPRWLSKTAVKLWPRIIKELEGMDILTVIDGNAIAAYCQEFARYVDAQKVLNEKGPLYKTESNNIITSPMLWVSNRALEAMHKYEAEFGMTPASRSRISLTPNPGTGDPMDAILRTQRIN